MTEITPDTKDWTWTLERSCPDCGFEAAAVGRDEVAAQIRAVTAPWVGVLQREDVARRPSPTVWSPLEYACHVRDVCALFAQRARLMLDEDDPRFADWDQDDTAAEAAYAESDPGHVSGELASAAAAFAAVYDGVSGAQWERPGTRSNGSHFTVLSLGQYGLHDLAHHLWDVRVEHS